MPEQMVNLRQIGLALYEFEKIYGTYPSGDTIEPVNAQNPDHGYDLNGESSNALFRQLFAAQITRSEHMFYARIKDSVRPDGNVTPGNILEPRSCGFSYISGLSSKDDPASPIALSPLIPGTRKFDPKPFNGRAVVLRIDNSVASFDIQKDGHIYDKGTNLLSSRHPIWRGKDPDIRYPER